MPQCRRRGRRRSAWAERTAVERGDLVREIALALRERREELAAVVVEETGKPEALALGEADAAVELGMFVAGEGRRYYGRTTTASMPHRTVMAVRQPVGVAGLLISFNTPLPNVAWKVFPAIFCGNGAVLKPSEETPLSAHLFARDLRRGGAAGGRPQRRAGPRRGGRRCPRRASGRRSRQLHGLGGHGTLDRRDRGTAAGEGLPGAGRQERARRLRRRRPRQRRAAGQCSRSFSNAGQRCAAASTDRRLRRRVRRVPAPLRRGRGGVYRHGPGDQRGEPRAHPRGSRAGQRGGWNGAVRGRALPRDGWWLRADRGRGRRPPTPRSRAPSCSAR